MKQYEKAEQLADLAQRADDIRREVFHLREHDDRKLRHVQRLLSEVRDILNEKSEEVQS